MDTVEIKARIGQRLDGAYQSQMKRIKSIMRRQPRSISCLSQLKPLDSQSKLLYETKTYSSLNSPSPGRGTIPRSRLRRETVFLPKPPRDYQLGYSQGIGPSHTPLIPLKHKGVDFSKNVDRAKVYFLKNQSQQLDKQAEIRR